ncbi:MAG: pyrroline-5-carboxylate reductase [Saprospiraceae bacterium]|nr:pyrroline-5-carboxylate reductase [Saprospiraceae bacterium]
MHWNKKMAIIGGGNLGSAIAEGLHVSNQMSMDNIWITRRNTSQLKRLSEIGMHVTKDNMEACEKADIIILAIKPYQAKDIMHEIKSKIDPSAIVISVVTGLELSEIKNVLGKDTGLFRAMPNTAIAIRESMTCICHYGANEQQIEDVDKLFGLLGKNAFIQEALMEAATVLGACGTAYAMRYIRANIQGGIEIGFDAKTANLIAAQTVLGASQLLLINGTHPEEEIDKVTTPKGCTIAGLNEMEHRGFSSSLIKGIATSYRKIAKDL